nr:cobalt-precorrin-7 (C(5))-methyltransferase [Pyrobaculum sp.]
MIYVIGAGPGDPSMIPLKALEILKKCPLVMGWRNVVDKLREYIKGEVVYLTYTNQEEILQKYLKTEGDVCIITHGDPCVSDWEFLERIKAFKADVVVINGVSSLNVALARLGLDMAHIVFATLHARSPQDLRPLVAILHHRVLIAFPYPTADGPQRLARELIALGATGCKATVLENLTLKDEQIWQGGLEELSRETRHFSDLSVVAVDCRGSS